jgi:hypothetical protein
MTAGAAAVLAAAQHARPLIVSSLCGSPQPAAGMATADAAGFLASDTGVNAAAEGSNRGSSSDGDAHARAFLGRISDGDHKGAGHQHSHPQRGGLLEQGAQSLQPSAQQIWGDASPQRSSPALRELALESLPGGVS